LRNEAMISAWCQSCLFMIPSMRRKVM
jgi:hypothetical protein